MEEAFILAALSFQVMREAILLILVIVDLAKQNRRN